MKNNINPQVMPVDRDEWYKKINKSNFVNSSYQYMDLQQCDDCKKILEVGCGQGLTTQILRWKGFDVSTFDIDHTFNPDYCGSVHDMSCFKDKEFDVVIASHVLEHLPVELLNASLNEISRISNYALIYLPIAGARHFQIRIIPGFRRYDFNVFFDIFNYFERPTGDEPRYCRGQHYWELGYRGFKINDMVKRFSPSFEVIKHYRNKDWNPSYNFVLKSREIEK